MTYTCVEIKYIVMPENDKLLGILQRIAALPEPERNALVENIGHTVRDNTRVAVNPGDVGFIPNSENRNPDRDVRLDDGIMGFMPVIGDALQAGQAVKDASEGKWGRAVLGAALLAAPNIIAQPIKSADKAIVKAVDDAFSPATQTLRRKMTRGQLMKILDENGAIRPLVREGKNLRFTKQKPRKAQYYIETDVPVKGVFEPEAFPEDMFADGSPFSKRFMADDGFTPNIYDDNVHIYERVPGGGYREVLKDELGGPDMAEYGIGNTRDIRTEKPIRLSEHRIHVPESPVQTAEGNTFYLDEVSSPGFEAKLKPYQKRDRLYVDSEFGGTQKGGDITEILKSKINNINEPSDVAKSMSKSAKRYYSNNYDVAAEALTDDEWARLSQTLLEKEQAKGNEVFFHSTYKDFDKVLPEELNKVNAGYLGNGFYLSDIPQADYGPIVMPFSMPRGKQLVLSTRNGLKHTDYGFLHADNKEADELLTRLRRPMVRWTKNGFKADRYGVWPGMSETSRSPEAWNNFIKENDFNVIKSERSSKGIGYKYPEIVVPPDKVNLLEFLYKSPQDLRYGGLLLNPYAGGGGIHIKPSKRGTFTAAAKKHGKSVQAFASQVLAHKENYSPAMVKKANFARNAAKWHADGGPLDNTIDYTGINTTNHRKYNPDYISYIDTSLANADISQAKRASILANIIEESGGNPFALDDTGKFYGLLQWADDRYKVTGEKDPYKEIDNQVNHILNTLGNTTDKVSWTHGGTGSGYNSYKDAMTDFDSDDLATAMKGFTLGYVRPTGKMDSYNNRLKVAEQLLQRYNSTPLQKVTNLAERIKKTYGGDTDAILRLMGSAKGGIR